MSWVWFFWIFVVIHGLIFQSITDAVAKKKGHQSTLGAIGMVPRYLCSPVDGV